LGEWLTKSEGKANENGERKRYQKHTEGNSMLFGNAINQNLQETHCNIQMWECMKQGIMSWYWMRAMGIFH